AHIPGEPGKDEAGGAQMVRVCDGSELPTGDKSKVYLLRNYGDTAHEIWDVTEPAKPARLSTVVDKLKGTHKSWWECDTGIAFLVSGVEGWRARRHPQVYDLSDPAKPVLVRNFGLPGHEPGASGPVPSTLHGPVSTGAKHNRVYFAYGANSRGGRFGTHSSNESFAPVYYKRIMFFAHFNAGVRALDIRDPFRPREIAYYVPAVTARTEKRCVGKGAEERCKIAIQTNNVEVD